MKKLFVFFFLLTMAFANEIKTFESSVEKTHIIELYTSQGCSSCPVADDWLNELTSHPQLFKTFIPLAFHVDYWDFIGWKDTFAQTQFTLRQRHYSSLGKIQSLYTPQFIIDAKEYRQWFRNRAFPIFNDTTHIGKLTANISSNKINIDFDNITSIKGKGKVNVAILGFDHNIFIKRGENRGKQLQHNFVVEQFWQYPITLTQKVSISKALTITKTKKRKALVVFVSDRYSNIIQAVGGFL
jgi:hypothetical protein